jgi:hypothetical protein
VSKKMTTQKSTNNGPVIGNSLPTPVCQQPDKNSPKGCAMQQLAGNQRKPAGPSKNTLNAVMLLAPSA